MKLLKSKLQLSVFVLIIIAIGLTAVSWNLNWTGNKWNGIIKSDGKGYYAYLPAVFIYNDLNFGFFEEIEKEKYYDELIYYDYRSSFNNKAINKYYCGTSLAQLPFFLTAHFLSGYCGCDSDGYSKTYQIFINLAALFYLIIGLFFLSKTLKLFGIKESNISFILITSVFATNLFYYVVCEPAMSHVYSFAFVSIFVFYSKKLFETQNLKIIPIIAVSLGMIVLIRPVNVLAVFLWPFLAGNYAVVIQTLRALIKSKFKFIYSSALFAAIISIQLIIYKISTGNYFVYSYGTESFNFMSPSISDILFSYKKGLFIYTPVFLVSFAGCYYLYKISRFSCISFMIFFAFITYIFSSWWMWYYGGSFSSRVYIEFIPVFMILLAIALQYSRSIKVKVSLVSIIAVLILLCQIQTYQYRYYKIHWSDMTKELYWEEFLRLDRLIK